MEKAAFNVFLATIALAIIAFLPPAFIPFMVVKTVIIALGVLVSLILYIVARIQAKSVEVPMHPILIPAALLGISVILSVLFSASPVNAFLGTNFDQYSGAFLLVVLLAGLLATLFVKSRERVFSVAAAVIGSFGLVALFQIARIVFGNGFLQLGTFTALTSTMAGSWYDLAILAGVLFIMSFISLESIYSGSLPVNKRIRVISISVCVVSFIFLFVIDLTLIWIGITIVAFLFAVYRSFFGNAGSKLADDSVKSKKFAAVPTFAIIVFVIAALFAWKGGLISSRVIQKLNVSYAEVSLPWQMTANIAVSTLRQSTPAMLFGAGTDRFPEQYLLYKPEPINNTQFWNITFPSGSSFILTSIVNQGVVGFALWIILFVWFVVLGVKAMLRPPETTLARTIVNVSFLSALFLWTMLFMYSSSQAVILVTLVMTGLFLAVLGIEYARSERKNVPKVKMLALHGIAWKRVSETSEKNGPLGKIVFIIMYVVLLVAVAGIFIFVKDAIAQAYFQAGVNESVAGNVTAAHASFEKALTFRKSDAYYQALSQVDSFEINSIISSATAASTSTVSTLGSLINEGIGFARSGEAIDHANANNFLAEGDVSELAAALNVPNAYANSKAAYSVAVHLSPLNPAIYLSAARLEYTEGSTTAAEGDINAALQLKPDYTDALFEAGVISYNVKDYQTAVTAFESVLKIDSTYANAEYFLGLTFARAGDTTDAITVFTDLVRLYPQNTTIATILSDLQAGKSVFSDAATAQPPATPLSPSPKITALSKQTSKTAKVTPKTSSADTASDDGSSASGASSTTE